MDINDLRKLRAEASDKVQALAKLEADGVELSGEQVAEYVTLSDQFEGYTAQIDRAEAAEKMAAVAAKPVVTDAIAPATGFGANTLPPTPAVKGGKVARMIQAIGAVGGSPREAAHYAEQTLGDPEVAMALNTGSGTAGGVTVPKAFSGELIELLQPESVVRSFNPVIMPMPHGNISISRLDGGATSRYISEGDEIEASEQVFGDLELSVKALTTLVPVSNQLLNYNGLSSSLEQVIVGDMVASQGLREDVAFIRGDGTNNTPTGLRNLALAANILVASDGSTIQKVKNDLGRMELQLLNANVKMRRPGWILSPTTGMFLQNLVDGNGNIVFPEMGMGMLRNKPYKMTTQVPANLGGGAESEIYLTEFSNAIIGESDDLTIAVSTEATYTDPATGAQMNAFTRNQTLIRVMSGHDFGMRHLASTCVLTAVEWTP